jgi:hypothetical protein
MLTLGQEDPIKLRNIVMSRTSHHTIFLLFDRPPRMKVGTYFPIEIRQLEARKQRITGGLNARIEVVTSPKREGKTRTLGNSDAVSSYYRSEDQASRCPSWLARTRR